MCSCILTGIGQNLGEGVSAPSELSVVPQLWSGSHRPAPQSFPHPELYIYDWKMGSWVLLLLAPQGLVLSWYEEGSMNGWNCQYGIWAFSELMGGI